MLPKIIRLTEHFKISAVTCGFANVLDIGSAYTLPEGGHAMARRFLFRKMSSGYPNNRVYLVDKQKFVKRFISGWQERNVLYRCYAAKPKNHVKYGFTDEILRLLGFIYSVKSPILPSNFPIL